LRRAGLDPAVNAGLKGKRELLDHLRTKTAQAAGISVPELAEPRRMSWNQVLVAAGTLIGGWALILTLINAAHSINTIRPSSAVSRLPSPRSEVNGQAKSAGST
jgi:hypothetical protein